MDSLGFDPLRYAGPLGKFLLARLDVPKHFRTLKIEPECVTYGTHVLPSRGITSFALRSKLFQAGTPVRQLLGIVAVALFFLGLAFVDARGNESALLKGILRSTPFAFVAACILIKNAAAVVFAVLVGVLIILVSPLFGFDVTPASFAEYSTPLRLLFIGGSESRDWAIMIVIALSVYASLSFLRFPWHARDLRNFLRFPYLPRMLTDLSVPRLAIERADGETLWIDIKPYPFLGPEDREQQAQFGAAIVSAFAVKLNQSIPGEPILIDLHGRGILSSMQTAIRDDMHAPHRELSIDEELAIAEQSLSQQPWKVVEREIVLLWHELESIPAPEAARMLRCLHMLLWFGAEDIANRSLRPLGFRNRPEDRDAADASKKVAKKALAELESHRSDQPLFWNPFKPFRTDGENTPNTLTWRMGEVARWIKARISEAESPAEARPGADDVAPKPDESSGTG